MPKKGKIRKCFVIAPIGEEGSETRRRSDQILKHVIGPATEECGYKAIRADQISEPGIITSQVIQHIIDDDLVIADLTGKNPNVFYELAVRHTVKKPVVQIIQSGESIPFDVAPTRTIHVDHRDLDSVADCRDELIKQIKSVEKNPANVDSPISVAIDLQSLHSSENPLEKSNAEIISMLQELPSRFEDKFFDISPSRHRRLRHFHPMMFEDMIHRISDDSSDPIGLLILAGLVRDDLPWIYEIIMEAYREAKNGNINEARKSFHQLRHISKSMMRGPWLEEMGIHPEEFEMWIMELPMFMDHYLSRLEARTKKKTTKSKK